MLEGYNYTDLIVVVQIDPTYCTGTLRASLESVSGGSVELSTLNYNVVNGEVVIALTQVQSAALYGVTAIQIHGFLSGARWASKKVYVVIGKNGISRELT